MLQGCNRSIQLNKYLCCMGMMPSVLDGWKQITKDKCCPPSSQLSDRYKCLNRSETCYLASLELVLYCNTHLEKLADIQNRRIMHNAWPKCSFMYLFLKQLTKQYILLLTLNRNFFQIFEIFSLKLSTNCLELTDTFTLVYVPISSAMMTR